MDERSELGAEAERQRAEINRHAGHEVVPDLVSNLGTTLEIVEALEVIETNTAGRPLTAARTAKPLQFLTDAYTTWYVRGDGACRLKDGRRGTEITTWKDGQLVKTEHAITPGLN